MSQQPSMPTGRDRTSGKQLLTASWGALKQDRTLLALPVMSSVFAAVAVALIWAVGIVTGHAFSAVREVGERSSGLSLVGWLMLAASVYVTTTIALYFQVALAAGAMQRMDGGDPTLSSCLAVATKRLPQILAWAVIATTIGLILRAIAERVGLLGDIVVGLVGVAWGVVTFFVVPVLAVEGTGPVRTLRTSKDLLVRKWGKVGRSSVRFGLLLLGPMLLGVLAVVGGGFLFLASYNPLFLVICALGLLVLLVVGLLSSAVMTYLRTALYRHAVGMPVPGIPEQVLATAIASGR